ncbi:flagellar hook-basal body complex protein FliE [Desulfopila sp. IMCC35008]|uniref:flagellar hook-basal body complex protein FliE n=1 Tax=Desulfopila sp. IMCC35008 TaxID=2653858 RepID=UPI0013D86827|nr:flagellar hook-basal body complex protein FliE [Desulfopila sp. IMCC35008]
MSTIFSVNQTTPLPLRQPDTSPVSQAKSSFGEMLTDTITQVNQSQMDGEKGIEKLQTGEAKNLHEVMLAVEQADISLRMLVQMRNKAQQAYEEIMRMQI